MHATWFPTCVSLLINTDTEMHRHLPDSEASCGEELRKIFCLAKACVKLELIYSVSYDVRSAATAGLQPQVHLGVDLCWTVSAGLFLEKKGELKPGIFVRKGFFFFFQNLQSRCTFVFYRKSIITSYF